MKNRNFIQVLSVFVILAAVLLNTFLAAHLSLQVSNDKYGTDLGMIDDVGFDIALPIDDSFIGLWNQTIGQNQNDPSMPSGILPSISFEPVTFCRSGERKTDEKHVVTFLTSDGQILEDKTAEHGEIISPPQNPPVPPGEIFTGWDTDIDKITDDVIIKEETINVTEMENALAISGGYCKKGKTVTVPLQLCGKVCLSGLDLSIRFDPEELQFKEFSYEDDAVICNYDNKTGEIKLNFLSFRNVQGDVELCDMVFKAVGNAEESPLSITVKTIIAFDDNDDLYEPKYRIIDGTVRIIK